MLRSASADNWMIPRVVLAPVLVSESGLAGFGSGRSICTGTFEVVRSLMSLRTDTAGGPCREEKPYDY